MRKLFKKQCCKHYKKKKRKMKTERIRKGSFATEFLWKFS